jgi:hypothetical protein
MNFAERRKYWLAAGRQMRKHEVNYAKKIQALIKRQVDALVKEADSIGFQAAWSKMPMFNDEFIKLIMDLYKKVGLQFAINVNRSLQIQERKDVFFNADIIQRIVNILGRHALDLVTRMDDTTKQELLKIITQGEEQQLSYREIALNIESSNIVQYSRALTIARTEVGRASNVGAMEAAAKSRTVLTKEWVAGNDKLTRRFSKKDEFDHWAMDGQVREMDANFEQTGLKGITAVAAQPGDPNAPASFTINCRCVVAFTPKRDERGRLVKR